jgi:hypothetical protein
MITEFLKRLITKKFYKEKSEIDYKLNVFYATGKITAEEFTELTILLNDTYVDLEDSTEEVIENNTEEE